MKTKPVLIAALILVVLVGGYLFARGRYTSPPEKTEIINFLNAFNTELKAGNTTKAIQFFDDGLNKRNVASLVNALCNRSGLNGKSKPSFKISLNTEDAIVTFIGPDLAEAIIAVRFTRDSVPDKLSAIGFNIRKTGQNQYKISKISESPFADDYGVYQNKVFVATVPETDIFSPLTLESFKAAKQLQTKYDSVLWFQHIKGKTFYYVIKGKLPERFYWVLPDATAEPSDFKMGLVNPELKEIIPVEYDLIHNIGGCVDSLIEVEKNGKKGFFDVAGKVVVPVVYDQILPLTDDENLALLKKGSDYSYLKKDMTLSETLQGFGVADVLPKIKHYNASYTITEKGADDVMEYNSKVDYNSLIVAPSYLVEWQMLPRFVKLPNTLRKSMDEEGDGSRSVAVNYRGEEKQEGGWFQSAFYSIVNDYLGGRGGLYETKQVLVVDKKQNRILGANLESYMGQAEGSGLISDNCNENSVRALNDSLFEFKTTSNLDVTLFATDRYIKDGPYYHYLQIKNGKLVPLKGERLFPTQYVKLDDRYLQGCYVLTNELYTDKLKLTTVDHITGEMLQYMKNEIYGSYRYQFKDKRWNEIFDERFYNPEDTKKNVSVEDSLTVIDRYNINWINNKLKEQKAGVLASK